MGDPNDGGSWEVDPTMVPQPLRIRKSVYQYDVNTKDPLGISHQISTGPSRCYWQSDSWQMFKSLEDSVYDFPQVDSRCFEMRDEPEFSGMDLEPLRRLQMQLAADEGAERPGHAKPAGRVSSTEFRMLIGWDGFLDIDRVGQLCREPSKHMSWYANILPDIVYREDTVNPTAAPHVLSNTVTASLWIREQMRNKWKQIYNVALAPQILDIRRRIEGTENAADRQIIVAEKTRMMRRALKRVVADGLSEVARALRSTLEAPLREIESLYTFLLVQQHLFLRSLTSLSCLVTIQYQQHSSLAQRVNETAPFLSTQLDAIDSVFGIGLHTIAAIGTRIGRVTAKDVPGAEERERESKRRLEDPAVVLGYLAKVEEDFLFLKLWAKTAESSFENIEEELEELAGGSVDLCLVGEACLLFAED